MTSTFKERFPGFEQARYYHMHAQKLDGSGLACSFCTFFCTLVSMSFPLLLVRGKVQYQTSCSISATLGTLFRRTPAKAAIISICSVTRQQTIRPKRPDNIRIAELSQHLRGLRPHAAFPADATRFHAACSGS